MKIGGIVLCGGQSSRMGRPKAWLPFGSELMLQRVVRVLQSVVDPVVVVAALGQEVPELSADVRIIRDEVSGRGPLQGLATGLTALEGEVDAVYLSSCDVPFLTAEFVRRVVELLGEKKPDTGEPNPPTPFPNREGGAGFCPSPRGGGAASEASGVGSFHIAVPRVGGYFHPLAAAYRSSVLPRVRELLAADRLRPVFLFDVLPTRVIEPGKLVDVDPEFRSLRNLNTPEEYEQALGEVDEWPA